MQRTLKKLVFLLALVCTVICCVAFAACGDNGNGGNNSDDKITYSVTVTSTDTVEYTSITAYWKIGTKVEGSATLSANGTASVQLAKATYTVDLGTVEGYTYTAQTAKATAPNVNITLTPDSSNTHTLKLTVSSELPLPADAAVDIYDAEGTPVLEAVSIKDGLNNIAGIPNDTDVTVVFVSDVDYLEGEVNVTSSETTSTLNITAKEIVYTVTVDAEAGLDLDGVTVALTAVGKDDVTGEIEDGVATISALAGEYTVELKDLNPAYEYESATVSYENAAARTATINVAATVYIVTLDKLGNTIDESTLTVELLDGEGEKVTEATFEDGVAKLYAMSGDYTITVKGLSNEYGYIAEEFNANKEATVHMAPKPEGGSQYVVDGFDGSYGSDGTPYTINAVGSYYIEIQTYEQYGDYITRDHIFKFTAPEEGEKFYTFSWKYVYGSDIISKVYGYETEADVELEGISISYIINYGEEVTFALSYAHQVEFDEETYEPLNPVGEDPYFFILVVEAGEAPTDGDMYKPVEIANEELEGEHTGPEGKTDVYFKLSPSFSNDQSFTITFEGATAYFSNTNITDVSEIASGSHITITAYSNGYLRVVASSTPVKFSLEEYIAPGANPNNAIEITEKGKEVEYYAETSGKVWFTFVPAATGDYRIFNLSGFDIEILVGTTPTEAWDGWTIDPWEGEGYVGSTEDGGPLHLEVGVKYYLMLYANLDSTAIFKIDDYVAFDGEKGKPIVANNGENLAENISSSYTYFVYEATADGIFKFSYAADDTAYVYFFSDAGYENGLGIDNSLMAPGEVWQHKVKAGDKIYFTISSYYTDTVKCTIEIADDSQEPDNAEIPAEILEINWTSEDGQITLTATTVSVTYTDGESKTVSGAVTEVSEDGNTITITFFVTEDSTTYTIMYNKEAQTLTFVVSRGNSIVFSPAEN